MKNNKSSVVVLLSILATTACCCMTVYVHAQESAGYIEELIVSASRRKQAVGTVDISMKVFAESLLTSRQFRTLPELADFTENVMLFEDIPGASIPTWVIRGVGLQDFNVNNTPTAGVYADGVYQVSTAMGTAALFDVEQVEILKGPQGGLYGRNTSGGAVLLNTKRASLEEQAGYIKGGYSRWQRATLDGAYNLPVTDTLAVRIAGSTANSNGGWQRSLATGQKHGEQDRWDSRMWLSWQPSADFTMELKLQAGEDNSDIPLGRSISTIDPDSVLGAPPIPCAALSGGVRNDYDCLNMATFQHQSDYPNALQAADGSTVYSEPLNRQNNDYSGALLSLEWLVGNVSLQSLSSFDDFHYGIAVDLDASPGEFGHRISGSDIQVFSQEFRILTNSHSSLQWMLGVGFTTEDYAENRDFNLRENRSILSYAGVLHYDQETTAASLYADITYDINDNWRLNSTMRYTDEEKRYRNGSLIVPVSPPFVLVNGLSRDYTLDSPLSGSLALDWFASDNSLLYLKFSRGFKSGGFYGGLPTKASLVDPYKEETINAWELGLKQQWPELRLGADVTVFTYDYRNAQGFIKDINALTETGVDRLGNLGDARHTGAELALALQATEHLQMQMGLGWLDAEFENSDVLTLTADGLPVNIHGVRPWAPRWNSNLMLRYAQPIMDSLDADFTLDWNYRSDFSGELYTPFQKAINRLPGYALVNAGFGLSSQAGWTVSAWVRNITNKVYRSRVKDDGLGSFSDMFGEPRSFGVSVMYKL